MLAENLGQPGFRELMIIATDLDSRGDVVAAMLRDPYRRDFIAPRRAANAAREALDLADLGRDHAVDVMSAALTPPVACEPRPVTFAPDGYWRGKPIVSAIAPARSSGSSRSWPAPAVSQLIVVTAVPASSSAPHRLRVPRLDVRSRLGEFIAAAESASLRDAIDLALLRFDSLYVICPSHNPVGPFDFAGAYDEASDRRYSTAELMEQARGRLPPVHRACRRRQRGADRRRAPQPALADSSLGRGCSDEEFGGRVVIFAIEPRLALRRRAVRASRRPGAPARAHRAVNV